MAVVEPRPKRSRQTSVWILASGLVVFPLLYVLPTDAFLAYTIYPFGLTWSAAAMLTIAFSLKRRALLWFLAPWTLAWFMVSDEPWALVRGLDPTYAVRERTLKIVTLNCAGGNIEAAREAMETDADIILLQESPSHKELERLFAGKYRGVTGPDAAIWTKGQIKPIPLPKGTTNFVAAHVDVKGQLVTTVSLRLSPPILRFDYWNPECWRAYAEDRRRKRAELQEILDFIKPHQIPFEESDFVHANLIGGDFNMPHSGRIRWSNDAFASHGKGWGGTAVNEYPLARIDRIHIEAIYKGPKAAWAVRTKHSDHRMVVALFE
jgi:vancomycin resistance protein VanJ